MSVVRNLDSQNNFGFLTFGFRLDFDLRFGFGFGLVQLWIWFLVNII